MVKKSIADTRIIVGMSGGVDSSVAALLLKQQGYHVEGFFMKNWEEDDNQHGCNAAQDMADASSVCVALQIPFHTVNFSNVYWDHVFTHFLDEYHRGRTPNPDILCNKEIKFKAFLDHAITLGADGIATGHYARCYRPENQATLLTGKDAYKDQSYFLYALNQAQLGHSFFPLGEYTKPQVRAIAQQANFVNHNKKDSTGLCFIGERRFDRFLKEYLPAQPGKIETLDGRTIGQHSGLMYHTIGQRKGLGIGGLKGQAEKPWYVVSKDIKRNVLVVVQDEHHPALLSRGLIASHVHWISGVAPDFTIAYQGKIRYRQPGQSCHITTINENDQSIQVLFDIPQRAITPGQSIVFYQGEVCLGGGIIEKCLRH